MILTRRIAGQAVMAECEPALAPAAEDVLRTLEGMARAGTPPRDGLRLRFGWSLLTLRAEAEGLRICEPAFDGATAEGLHPRLDTTLGVIAAQLVWLDRLGEIGRDVTYDQVLVVTRDALMARDVFALRGEAAAAEDSGWSVAPVPRPGEPIDRSGQQALPVHRLVALRPGLLPVLALPVGYLVTLAGEEVVEVDAPDGRTVWRA
jgi:hypothetical protein